MNNIIILDTKTDAVLYGRVLMEIVRSTGREQDIRIYRIPGEAYTAFLQHSYAHLPEVQKYLAALDHIGAPDDDESVELLSPEDSKLVSDLLYAVDEQIDLSTEVADQLAAFVRAQGDWAE